MNFHRSCQNSVSQIGVDRGKEVAGDSFSYRLRMGSPSVVSLVFVLFALMHGFLCKECTNIPSQLSSHTFRSELLSSINESWKESMFSSYRHLIPSDDSAWSSIHPNRMLRQQGEDVHLTAEQEFNWTLLYRKIRHAEGESPRNSEDILNEISLHRVRLDKDSVYGIAQQTNLEYLLMLDVNNLVWSFRKTAGLATPGSPYGGWESPTSEVRGHFVGHYMSSSALMWASTHNVKLRYKMNAVVNALYECQHKMGTGYLSAFPSELFDRFEAIQPVWAPYYTIHKIMTGLLDQFKFTGNTRAFKMVVWMAEYFYERVQKVISEHTIERHWLSLNEETGGMNEVLYRLFTLTGDERHLQLAHLFDKPCFLGFLAVQVDSLSGFHANTHIPVVIGSQMRYEVTRDSLYKDLGTYFMDIINSSHSYATGGTSKSEFWTDPKRLASTLTTENEESCTTYNMLKVARNLFRWTKAMPYADYYERALMNGVLSIQRGREPGVMIYMLPLKPGASKSLSYHGWGNKFNSFWCCYGTAIESFSKLGDSIYFQEGGNSSSLYVIQFISSTLSWDTAGLILKQTVGQLSSWDPYLRVSMEFSNVKVVRENIGESTLNIRIPFWTTANGSRALLNDEEISLPYPGNFLTITRKWKTQDTLSLLLPVGLRTEGIKDDRPQFTSVQAILFGPYLLAGMTNGDWNLDIEDTHSFSDWIIPVPNSFSSRLLSFCQEGKVSGSDEFDNTTLVFTHSNNTILMEQFPLVGTNEAARATFRIIDSAAEISNGEYRTREPTSAMDFVGNNVYLELFNCPGMLVAHKGIDKNITVINTAQLTIGDKGHCSVGYCSPSSQEMDTVFRIVPGLDGRNASISFESANFPSCFLFGGASYQAGQAVQLRCKPEISDLEFNRATSFTAITGTTTYHPISFIARGLERAYLLAPLLNFRDESYTVYFNITSRSPAV